VFDSYATDLVEGDTNNSQDIVLRDRQTGAVERISVEIARTSMTHDNPRSLNNPRVVEVWVRLEDPKAVESLIHAQVEVLFSAE